MVNYCFMVIEDSDVRKKVHVQHLLDTPCMEVYAEWLCVGSEHPVSTLKLRLWNSICRYLWMERQMVRPRIPLTRAQSEMTLGLLAHRTEEKVVGVGLVGLTTFCEEMGQEP